MNHNESLFKELDDKVAEYLLLSRNCAQTSFASLQDVFGLEGDAVLKALTPFPGIALRGETCGALVGSLMALGLIFGREELDDQESFLTALTPAREFCQSFEKALGSTMCSDIHESEFGKRYDLTDPEQVAEWQAAGSLDKCTAVVRKATRIAAEVILSKKN